MRTKQSKITSLVELKYNLISLWFFLICQCPYWFPASCTDKYIKKLYTPPLSNKSHLYYLLLLHILLPFLLQYSTSKGNRVEKKPLSISYHSAILNGSQYLYIMLSTLQYHYRLNSASCKKYHSEHKDCNSSNEKRVISVFQLEWKIKITKALSSKENWQIKGTKNKIFMAHIVKWKVNNLRWTIMWEIALFLKSKKQI